MGLGLLLCTDLDRTLIPNGPQRESPGARACFKRLCESDDVALAYVSGRDRNLVEKAIADYALPQPDYVVGDVGTTLYRVGASDSWTRLSDWESDISHDWKGKSHQELQALFADIRELRLQESGKQNRYKLSYYVALHHDHRQLRERMRQRLEAQGVKSSLVWSVDEAAGVGLLDVLPARATKYHAIEYLRQTLGYSEGEILFSGDSGNDLDVLASPIPAVLVANAQAEVRDQAQRLAREGGMQDALYLAKGGFMGMNGNYGAGILEGLAHYHPALTDRLFEP
ncbi:MAG: HAD-IIB family hydrolase [Candidatus Thiodiazotropha sp. (ex Dulcina madagascariensis)]|nr:HAD-IIB family hydrolase [Candidatus Thiodiazotropha sp. (ex Dulcina madagascariensis)]MCU7928003.1 HAD-IIB family hydrolase [Candidatus Thiodiazotropha sp. (ex Dulcina madagascariensis)]